MQDQTYFQTLYCRSRLNISGSLKKEKYILLVLQDLSVNFTLVGSIFLCAIHVGFFYFRCTKYALIFLCQHISVLHIVLPEFLPNLGRLY
jgi:hypothetical protein